MANKLHYNTAKKELLEILKQLMSLHELNRFRLVGGTALSLQIGHRISVDIDLFTDEEYGSVNFDILEKILKSSYSYFLTSGIGGVAMGCSYYIGRSEGNSIKLDLFYTEKFIAPIKVIDDIRLADVDDIVAMKIEVISHGGRKKDFWDIHELLSVYSIGQMLKLHEQRYPFTHNEEEIRHKFTDFKNADNDFDPICLRGKYWEIIKLDISEAINSPE